jgi:bis(5'-nucleosidyl)-tetraphosphatase
MPDCSFGTIPFRVEEGVVHFLLVWENWGDGHWNFPKGHPEDGETPIQTALRELREETSLVPEIVVSEEPLVHEYSFEHDGRTIDRRLEYFLVFVDRTGIRLQMDEVSKSRWMTLEELLAERPPILN